MGVILFIFDSNAKVSYKIFFIFFSINLVVIIIFIVKFNIVANSSTLIYDGRKIDFSSIDIAVFGHSQSQAGIDENIISKN